MELNIDELNNIINRHKSKLPLSNDEKEILNNYNKNRHLIFFRRYNTFKKTGIPIYLTKMEVGEYYYVIENKFGLIRKGRLVQVTNKGYNIVFDDSNQVLSIGKHFYRHKTRIDYFRVPNQYHFIKAED